MVVMADLSDGGSGEVRQQLCLLLLLLPVCAWMQIYPGCLREVEHIGKIDWTASCVEELCAEVQWISAFQKPVNKATAFHSFDPISLPEPNPLVDLADIEENGPCWDLPSAMVKDIVEDFQSLQCPMLDVSAN